MGAVDAAAASLWFLARYHMGLPASWTDFGILDFLGFRAAIMAAAHVWRFLTREANPHLSDIYSAWLDIASPDLAPSFANSPLRRRPGKDQEQEPKYALMRRLQDHSTALAISREYGMSFKHVTSLAKRHHMGLGSVRNALEISRQNRGLEVSDVIKQIRLLQDRHKGMGYPTLYEAFQALSGMQFMKHLIFIEHAPVASIDDGLVTEIRLAGDEQIHLLAFIKGNRQAVKKLIQFRGSGNAFTFIAQIEIGKNNI